jgi:transcriptional regulator with XRE-family HTH domain
LFLSCYRLPVRVPTENRPSFSRNLIKYRKARGLTQVQLAQLSGISNRMIAYYETNAASPPLANVLVLAKALHVSLEDLSGANGSKQATDLFEDIDMRTLKKIMMIRKLPKRDRVTIYNMIDAMLNKTKAG